MVQRRGCSLPLHILIYARQGLAIKFMRQKGGASLIPSWHDADGDDLSLHEMFIIYLLSTRKVSCILSWINLQR
ncbi:hypothetical protein BX666DRAFT_1885737 [Dichotomocladium elegans]|nr:hypothetical protein BX666DRAFT_1885737 [Dichotomocladium elegans]